MLLTDIIDEARSWANDPNSSGFVSDTELANLLSSAQLSAYNAIRLADQNYFEQGQAIRLRSITLVEITLTDGTRRKIDYIRHQEIPRPAGAATGIPYLYYIIGD